jgi:hypothetical protein
MASNDIAHDANRSDNILNDVIVSGNVTDHRTGRRHGACRCRWTADGNPDRHDGYHEQRERDDQMARQTDARRASITTNAHLWHH